MATPAATPQTLHTTRTSTQASLPQRRRKSTGSDNQCWTAPKCTRLLRQIRSRLLHLRQLLASTTDLSSQRVTPKRKSHAQDADPNPKRARHKYGGTGRGRRKTVDRPAGQSFNACTPRRNVRVLGTLCPAAQYSSPLVLSCPTPAQAPRAVSKAIVDAGSRNRLGRLPVPQPKLGIENASNFSVRNFSSSNQDEYHATCSQIALWLRNLLGNTTTSGTPQRTLSGHPAQSLISMCARQVPECIAEIQAWDRRQAEEDGRGLWAEWADSNAITSMYEELQEAYGEQETGWCHFKALVRAHVIGMLVGAINDRLFTQNFILTLVQVCEDMSSHEEAARLLKVASNCCVEAEDVSDSSMSELLNHCRTRSHGDISTSSHVFGVWETLVLQKRTSILDLAAHRPPKLKSWTSETIWDDCLRCVTQPTFHPQAASFLRLSLSLLATENGDEEWSAQPVRLRRLVSICAGLVSTMLAEEVTQRCQRKLLSILDMAIAECRSASPHASSERNGGLFLLTLARQMGLNSISSTYSVLSKQGATELQEITIQSKTNKAYQHTVLLAASTAQALRPSQQAASHQALTDVCNIIQALPLPCWFHKGLMADAAFVLAQKTKNLRDLAFAESVKHTQEHAAVQDSVFYGWIWDAGISEWILPDPSGTEEARVTRAQGSSKPMHEDNFDATAEPSPGDESWLSTESSMSEEPATPELPPLVAVTGMCKADKARRLGVRRKLMSKGSLSGTKYMRKTPRRTKVWGVRARVLCTSPCSSLGAKVSAASGNVGDFQSANGPYGYATPTKNSKLSYSIAHDAGSKHKKRNTTSRPAMLTPPKSKESGIVANTCVRVHTGSAWNITQPAPLGARLPRVPVHVCELEARRGPCSKQTSTRRAVARRVVRTVSLSSLSGRARSGAVTVDDDDWDELG